MVSCEAAEVISETFLQTHLESAKEAVLDGGAQSSVVGQNTLDKYADYLRTQEMD